MRKNLLWGSLAVAIIVGAACTQDFDYTFKDTGTGGTGGTTTTSGGSGGGYDCQSPADCDDDGNDCTQATCSSGVCGTSNQVEGTECTDSTNEDAKVCDGQDACVECNSTADCDGALVCSPNNNCVPADCIDGSLNGDETDVDCGGPDCDACENADDCILWSDCMSRFCDTSGGGGGGAGGAAGGSGGAGGGGGGVVPTGVCAACAGHGDCQVAHYCENTGVCEDDFAGGVACVDDEQCDVTGGACSDADAICCDAECTGDCESCLGALTAAGNGNDGACLAETDANSCDDNVYCNGTDTCSSGACNQHSGNPCPGPDGDGDCSESCNEGADNCQANDPNNSVCDDGQYCNGTDMCNNGGACSQHTGDPCPGADGDLDCTESCNETGDDCTANDPNASVCDDGLFCTDTDTCQGGTCTGINDPCQGADGDGDCSETCDESANNCDGDDPNGSPCDDGAFCTGADTCNATGSCVNHVGDPCDGPNDGDADCSETCNETNNNCLDFDGNGTLCTGAGSEDTCCTNACVVGTSPGTCP